jgi:hypothetical protein
MTAYEPGTLILNAGTAMFTFSGTAFRLIPHASTDPLATAYSLEGRRWNPTNAFEVMYTFTNVGTARQWMAVLETRGSFTWSKIPPEYKRDLVVLNLSVAGLVDLATNAGLTSYNLPPSYPTGFEDETCYPRTQPIGSAIYDNGAAGIVARSASAINFTSAPVNWAELAVFASRTSPPNVVDRVSFDDWFPP